MFSETNFAVSSEHDLAVSEFVAEHACTYVVEDVLQPPSILEITGPTLTIIERLSDIPSELLACASVYVAH